MTQDPGAGKGRHRFVKKRALVGTGHDEGYRQCVKKIGPDTFEKLQAEMRAHAGTQHLGRPQCCRALERNDLAESKGARAAQNGADIAGILYPVQNNRGGPRSIGRCQRAVRSETPSRPATPAH